MNKKISLGSALILMSFAVLLTFMITFVNTNNRYNKILADTELNSKITVKLAELERQIEKNYIKDIDSQKLLDGIADGYVRGLGDRYAEYMPSGRYDEYIRATQGKMVGIGVDVTFINEKGGVIQVETVYEDSPAEAGGMLEGDYIYKVEEELVSELGFVEAVNKVKGEEGTNVVLTILRGDNHSDEIQLAFTRAEVKLQTVRHRMINSDIGYIKIKDFNQETPNEFIEAMNELEESGAVKYIFDVRNNPGGDLLGITNTLNYLLPEGPIVRIVYKDKHEESILSDADEITAPMVVLMNEYTASAAELFCAALKDYEKAMLIGIKTFGKGTMQSIYQLSDKSALKISSAKYNPPFSDNYDGIGIVPHLEIKLPEDLLKEKILDKFTDEEDSQLQAAIQALE